MALYAFDGTWNVRDRKDAIETVQPPQYGEDASFRRETAETNVHRFRELYGADRSEYLEGVGTRFGLAGRGAGGFSGAGGRYRIRHMYEALCRRYVAGDRDIDVIGFSRGAALAVHFANVVARLGIRDFAGARHLAHRDKELGWMWRLPRTVVEPQPAIRFLGLWDTVASFGVPVGPLRNRSTRWLVREIPTLVTRCFHAMALDEVRATFSLVRPKRRAADAKDPNKTLYEMWFRGIHSNVGGGYFDRGLSDIALAWMMEMYLWTLDKEAKGDLKLPQHFTEALQLISPSRPGRAPWSDEPDPELTQQEVEARKRFETLEPDPNGELGRESAVRRQNWRPLLPGDQVHHSVFRRSANLMTDHRRANRPLLRRIPHDARAVYDPPYFYSETPTQQAERIAREAFRHIPVRAADWLTVGNRPVIRSDHWFGTGHRRIEVEDDLSLDTFVHIASAWLLQGRCPEAELLITQVCVNHRKQTVPGEVARMRVMAVLRALEPHVPAITTFSVTHAVKPTSAFGV